MKRPLLAFILLMILIVLGSIQSCSDDNNNMIIPSSTDEVDETALLDTLEARNIALWISGELTINHQDNVERGGIILSRIVSWESS